MTSPSHLPERWVTWEAALRSYAEATGMVVSALDEAGKRRLGPFASTRFGRLIADSRLWQPGGAADSFEGELAARVVHENQPVAVMFAEQLRVNGLPLRLFSRPSGVIIFGWVHGDFATSLGSERLAALAGVAARKLWSIGRLETPVSERRMSTYAALLATIVDSGAALREAGERLEELAAEAKDRALFSEQMVGIVSHDLRNPLSSIGIGLELLQNVELPDTHRRVVDRVSRAAQRANRLILDLLDFTQARLGRGLPVTLRPIDFHATIAAVVEELQPVYPERSILHVRVGEGSCVADPDRLAQLAGNLVSNAMAYGTPTETVRITSTVDEAWVSLSVHNHGEPIPEELRSNLFQPMTRGTHVGSASRSVGLGLFIVREIAKAHGGTADVESSKAQGTTFTARFPRG